MSIHVLAPEVASRIAAGEVVERPASAVKELVENSLDVGADEIRVEVREGGRRLVRVVDNGQGIPAAEAALAFERHATSKLRSADDLEHIATLGFRGEALASIASVAQVTLLTRHVDEEVGSQLRVEGGHLLSQEAKGAPPGTVVTVENLFYNVPARLKFLRQPATESGHIVDVVQRFAMAFPERRFSLVSDGRLLFQSTGSGRLHDVLVKVWGLDVGRQLAPVRQHRRTTRLPLTRHCEARHPLTRHCEARRSNPPRTAARCQPDRPRRTSPATSACPPSAAPTATTSSSFSTAARSRTAAWLMPSPRPIATG
ncbi:MAG: DNA mismatch repair endonuclease MutL [Anaerolineae bacterium]